MNKRKVILGLPENIWVSIYWYMNAMVITSLVTLVISLYKEGDLNNVPWYTFFIIGLVSGAITQLKLNFSGEDIGMDYKSKEIFDERLFFIKLSFGTFLVVLFQIYLWGTTC